MIVLDTVRAKNFKDIHGLRAVVIALPTRPVARASQPHIGSSIGMTCCHCTIFIFVVLELR
jgi:hypothetical protein